MSDPFEVKDEHIQELLNQIGSEIGAQLPEGWGFNLLIFSFAPGATFYISNAHREDVIRELKDFIERQEKIDGN